MAEEVEPVIEPTPPAAPQTPSIVDEYDIGDQRFVPSLDLPQDAFPAPAAPAAPAQPAASAPAQRDPATGRFVKPAEHPAYLVRLAESFGMSKEAIEQTPTDALGQIIHDFRTQEVALGREYTRQDLIQGASERRPSSGAPAQAPEPPTEPEYDPGLPDEFDPVLIKAIKDLGTKHQKEMTALRAEVADLRQRDTHRENLTTAEKIDGHFENIKHPLLGTGPGSDLTKESPELGRRLAVLGEARRLAGPRATTAQQLAKIPAAVKSLFGEAAPSTQPGTSGSSNGAASRISEQQWNDASLARPTQRAVNDEPKGEAKALRTAARMMREMGTGDEEAMIEEGFLPE